MLYIRCYSVLSAVIILLFIHSLSLLFSFLAERVMRYGGIKCFQNRNVSESQNVLGGVAVLQVYLEIVYALIFFYQFSSHASIRARVSNHVS